MEGQAYKGLVKGWQGSPIPWFWPYAKAAADLNVFSLSFHTTLRHTPLLLLLSNAEPRNKRKRDYAAGRHTVAGGPLVSTCSLRVITLNCADVGGQRRCIFPIRPDCHRRIPAQLVHHQSLVVVLYIRTPDLSDHAGDPSSFVRLILQSFLSSLSIRPDWSRVVPFLPSRDV